MTHGAEKERGLEQREIEIGAFALAQCREDCDRGKGTAGHVGDRQRRARGLLQPLSWKRQPARRRDVVDVVSGPLAPATGLAIAGDRAVHQASIVLAQGAVIDAQALRHTRTEAFHHHVGLGDELANHAGGISVFEIQRDAALVAVLGIELHRHIRTAGIAARRLDLDNVGAEVGQHRRGRVQTN